MAIDTKKAILIGCGSALAVAVLLIALMVAGLMWMAQDVQGVGVTVDGPMDAVVGEPFDLVVNVANEREKKNLELSDIDVAEEYLEAFTLVSTEPQPKSSMHVPIDNSRSFTFDVTIPPGETRAFTFRLRPEREGIYRGDVDVCEGARFITAMAQTVVKEAK